MGAIAAEIVQASKIVCRAGVAMQAEQSGGKIERIPKIERREVIVERKAEQGVAVTNQGAMVLIQKRLIRQLAEQIGEQKIAATPVLTRGCRTLAAIPVHLQGGCRRPRSRSESVLG